MLDESKMDGEHCVVAVQLKKDVCPLYAVIPNPIPNPRSKPLVPQSPPLHCSYNAFEPIPMLKPASWLKAAVDTEMIM